MPDLWVDVDTAVIVPVNIMPLLDDTDFKTIETAVVYNSAGIAVTWNFVTCAGVVTGTAVTPTTGGVYDWSEPVADKGMYAIEIPASGGVSINNDTEGVGWFTGVATGVLPWRGPTIGFRRAALNDLFIEGSTASTNLEDFFDGTGYAGGTARLKADVDTIKTQAVTCAAGVTVLASVGTAATSTAQTGDSYALANGVNGFVAIKGDTAAILTDTADMQPKLGTPAGASISADILVIDNFVDGLETTIGVAGAGLTDLGGMSTTMKAQVESEANDALVALNLDHLVGTATAIPAIPAGTFIDQMMDDGTAVFDRTTDSLQAIRDTAPLGTAMRGTDSAALASVCTEARLAELDAANLITDVANVKTDTAAILVDTGTTLDGRIPAALVGGRMDSDIGAKTGNVALSIQEKADVNAEVVDAVNVDTIAELAQGIPTATPTMRQAMMLPYMALRDKLDVDANFKEIHNDAGTVICKKALTDDGTTYSEAEMVSGP